MSPPPPNLVLARDRDELEEALTDLRTAFGSVGLVPTMGALHPGHLSLFERAAELTGAVVASIFVNPLQFGPEEDFTHYPRDLETDLSMAAHHGVRMVFAPEPGDFFREGSDGVQVIPGALGTRLCGPFRPGHFQGVLTAVAKLLGLFRPEVAVFGRKDLQQAALIRRMVRDLELGVRIEVAPLVRAEDGLALSSRNAYLSVEEREQALGLVQALSAADEGFRGGESRRAPLLHRLHEVLAGHPGIRLQYSDLVDAETLDSLEAAVPGAILAVAAFVGETRLIDNLVLGAEVPDPRLPDPHHSPSSANRV